MLIHHHPSHLQSSPSDDRQQPWPIPYESPPMNSVNDPSFNLTSCSRLVKESAAAVAELLCFPENLSYVGAKYGENWAISEPLNAPSMKSYLSPAKESNIWLSLGEF